MRFDVSVYWEKRAAEAAARGKANRYACALIGAGVWRNAPRRGGRSGPRQFAEGA